MRKIYNPGPKRQRLHNQEFERDLLVSLNYTSFVPPVTCTEVIRAALKWSLVSVFIASLAGCGGGGGDDVADGGFVGDVESDVIGAAGNPNAVFADSAGNGSNVSGTINLDELEPEMTELTVVMPEDTWLSLVLVADPVNEPVEIVSFPEFGAAVVLDGVLEYTPNANFFGRDVVRVERGSVGYIVEIIVSGVNDSPAIVGDVDRVAEQGVMYSSQVNVRNVDQDVLEFSSSNLPSWLILDAQTGELSGVPNQQDVGLYEDIQLFVHDSDGLSDSLNNVVIEVLDLNEASLLNASQIPDQLDARESMVIKFC